MKPIEKIKLTKTLGAIGSNRFDETNVDHLFTAVREYSDRFPVIREIGDFIAHPKVRNQGITTDAIRSVYYRCRFLVEYNFTNTTIDLTSPIPSWIHILMQLHVDRFEEDFLKKQFKRSKEQLKSRIRRAFKPVEGSDFVRYTGQLSKEEVEAVQYMMSRLVANPSISQQQLFDQLFELLQTLDVHYDNKAVLDMSDKITICILLLFHRNRFSIENGLFASCSICANNPYVAVNANYVDQDGNPIDRDPETFGKLSISATVPVMYKEKVVPIVFPIMSTDLNAEDWCTPELFSFKPWMDDRPSPINKVLLLDEIDLAIDERFKFILADRVSLDR